MTWNVLTVRPTCEAPVASELREKGADPYLPLVSVPRRVRHKRSLIDVKVPAFPGYLFLREVEQRLLADLRRTQQEVRLMTVAGDAVVLPDDEIARVKQLEKHWVPQPAFRIGDVVTSTLPAFREAVGEVLAVYGNKVHVRLGNLIAEIPPFFLLRFQRRFPSR